jgi:lysophospholipase L1-like esterase
MYRFIFIIIAGLMGCSQVMIIENESSDPPPQIRKFSYIALGDSYTIGHGLPATSSFPILLEKKLLNAGFEQEKKTKIIAKTGWSCDDLMKNISLSEVENNSYHLVTLLIGVNDQYRNIDIKYYPQRFTDLLNEAIRISGDKNKVVVLSIPDYSVTPFGNNSVKTAKEIAEYNQINKNISLQMGIKYVDITPISLKAKDDLTYLASDKLHPSEKMYIEWVNEMYLSVQSALKN